MYQISFTKKRICNYTHYTYMEHTFIFTPKQHYISLYWQKHNKKNFLHQHKYKKRINICNYEHKNMKKEGNLKL